MENKDLKSKTISALFWNSIDKFAFQLFKFVIGVILARLLVPEDYGYIGMLAIFLGIGNVLTDSGFGSALIQKKEIDDQDKSTVFVMNLVIGVFIYAIIYFIAPFIARFYGVQELTRISRILCLSILINSFGIVAGSVLKKNLDFRLQTIISVVSVIISGAVSIFFAYRGFGVWALVLQSIIRDIIRVALLNILVKWKATIHFSYQSFKRLFHFGYKLLIARFIDEIFKNVLNIVIGKIYSTRELGFYTKAYSFQEITVLALSDVINVVTFPVFSSIQDETIRIRKVAQKSVRLISFFVFPVLLGLMTISEPFVKVLLTEKWLPSVPYLQLLCVYGLLYPLHSVNLNIINALGRSDVFLKLEIIKKGLIVLAILITFRFGVTGLIYGQILVSILSFYINTFFNKKLVGYGFTDQLKDIFPYFVITVVMCFVVSLLGNFLAFSDMIKLLLLPVFGAALYLSFSMLLRLDAFVEIFNLVKSRSINNNKS